MARLTAVSLVLSGVSTVLALVLAVMRGGGFEANLVYSGLIIWLSGPGFALATLVAAVQSFRESFSEGDTTFALCWGLVGAICVGLFAVSVG